MKFAPAVELEMAISDMIVAAAMVDVMQSHLARNAAACREMYPTDASHHGPLLSDSSYRVMVLTENEARALDHVLNEGVCTAEKLRKAQDAIA